MRETTSHDQAGMAAQSASKRDGDVEARNWAEEWVGALEAAGRAVLALDATGRVVVRSPGAAAMLYGRLQIRDGHLAIAEPVAQRGLTALVEAALRQDSAPPGPLPPPLVIRRASGRLLHIDVWPVSGPAGGRIAVLLLLRETEGESAARDALLRERFRLTPAEVRLALAIADGEGLRSAAERLGIRMSTARAHLKSVFLKTETHRQAEVVALLARLG